MSASLLLALLPAVAAAAESPATNDVANLPVEAAVGFAAGPLKQQVRVLEVLSRWERAAAQLPPLTAAELDRALRSPHGKLTAHEAAVAARFRGPVKVKALQRDYRWSGVKQSSGEVRLTAMPYDPVERLFYCRFELQLNAATMLPTALRFEHADERKAESVAIQVERVTVQPRVSAAAIRLVKAESSTAVVALRPMPKADGKSKERLRAVLRRWQDCLARDSVREAGFYVYEYDFTFNIEKRSVGRFRFDHPNRFVVNIRPAKIERGLQSSRKDRNGNPLTLQAGHAASWSFDGKKLVLAGTGTPFEIEVVDPKNPTHLKYWYFSRNVPVSEVLNGLFPLARPTKADFATEYRWKIEKETAREIWLSATPVTKSAAASSRGLKVILDRSNYCPMAVQRIDPGGIRETVYVFNKWITVPRASE
jgi:hypothetical protein